MSLLYECINGIIQGGILDAVEGTHEGEEVARLIVGKLRGMMVIEGDANCKLTMAASELSRISSCHSKIRCPACFRQDCPLAPLLGLTATRCHHGVHRRSRHFHSDVRLGPGRRNGQPGQPGLYCGTSHAPASKCTSCRFDRRPSERPRAPRRSGALCRV